MGEEVGWKRHMEEGLAENVRIPSYGEGSKIVQKMLYNIWTFPKALKIGFVFF